MKDLIYKLEDIFSSLKINIPDRFIDKVELFEKLINEIKNSFEKNNEDVLNKWNNWEDRRISNVEMPPHWMEENIKPPTEKCKELAKITRRWIFKNLFINPDGIAASIEGGICLFYRHSFLNSELIIEIDNDLDAGYILNCKSPYRTIICSGEINSKGEICGDLDNFIKNLEYKNV